MNKAVAVIGITILLIIMFILFIPDLSHNSSYDQSNFDKGYYDCMIQIPLKPHNENYLAGYESCLLR